MPQRMDRFWRDETGQDLVEYSLLITFIAIACMWIVGQGRSTVNAIWIGANNTINSASTFAGS